MSGDPQASAGRAEVLLEGREVTVRLVQEWRQAYGGSVELLGLDIVGQIAAASTVAEHQGITAERVYDPQALAALASPGFVSRVLTVTDQLLSRPFQDVQIREHASARREVVVVTTGGRVTGVRIDAEWAKHAATQKLNDTLATVLDQAAYDEITQTAGLDGAMRSLQAEAADLLAAEGVR